MGKNFKENSTVRTGAAIHSIQFAPVSIANLKILFILLAIGLAVFIRILLFPYTSPDLEEFLVPWVNTIAQNGGLIALKEPFYNYTPPYMYFLTLAASFNQIAPASVAIKAISICFDFILAWIMLLCVRLKFPSGNLHWIAFMAVLFSPVILFDSAYWGQCDSIYSAFLLGCIYFVCIRKFTPALICFASAFAFKAQAIFLAPLFAIYFIKGLIPWWKAFLVPAFYFLWLAPSLVVGYPISNALTTYLNQADTYHLLSMNAPNIYVFISNKYFDISVLVGIAATLILFGIIIWFVIKNDFPLTPDTVIFISFLFTFLAPFFLPKMHERYFYLAVLLATGLPFFKPELRLTAWTLQVIIFFCFTYFLRFRAILPIEIPAIVNAILVCLTLIHFFKRKPLPPVATH